MKVKEESSRDNILSQQLPDIVAKLLVDYLDIFSLQALRHVCKTTTGWVETPELLRHFVVRITGKGRLDDILGAPDLVPWNTFLFTEKYISICEVDVQRFLAAYGGLVSDLTFNWTWEHQWPQLQLRLLSGCPHLISLRSIELNFDLISNELANQLLEKWKNLRHFHVEVFNGSPYTEPGPMPFFSRLLSTCTKLELLRVPMFKVEDAPLSDYGDDYSIRSGDAHDRHVLTPLLDTIGQGRLCSVEATALTFDDDQLFRLAFACRETSTVLRGQISFSFRFLRWLLFENEFVLDVLGDLYYVTDDIISHTLTNVRTIDLSGASFRWYWYGSQHRDYTIPPFPHLTSVSFLFASWKPDLSEDPKAMDGIELFAHRLIKTRRPSVKRLRAAYCEDPTDEFPAKISPADLCTSFVNLRVLDVFGRQGEDEEWLKLWPLVGQTLVELELHNCQNLRDRIILGDNLSQPAFLQLKHLRKLTLENRMQGKEQITELSFLHAFRRIRLQEFVFAQMGIGETSWNPPKFSVKTVNAMWDGVFGESIQEFSLQGEDMMLKRHGAKEKSSSGQNGNFVHDGHSKLVCCSIN